MDLLISRRECFSPKELKDVNRSFRLRSGTFEFIFESGERGGRLLDILSDASKGYLLISEGNFSLDIGGTPCSVDKFTLMKKNGSEDVKIGEVEAQWDKSGNLVSVFLGASNKELPAIADLVLGKG